MAVTTHLRALQALKLALRSGSMKGAAAQLSITLAALGQRIKSLEDYLGYDLLVRGRSGIRPTPELEAAVAHLGAAFRELDTVTRILDFQRVNEVHITADFDWADLWLKPRLVRFRKENPNTLFCINGIGDVPIRLGDADCGIWFGKARGAAVENPLFRDYLAPVSSPGIKQRVSLLPHAEMLEGFPLLHLDCYTLDAGEMGWKKWVATFAYRRTAPERGIRYQRLMHALEAVYANSGLLICGLALVMSQIKDNKLSLPFPVSQGQLSSNAYQVHFRPDAIRRSTVERFREWLLGEAEMTRQDLDTFIHQA